MSDVNSEIKHIVDRETRAWDTRNVELLLSVFHPDMVWPWPKTPRSHDPLEWVELFHLRAHCLRLRCPEQDKTAPNLYKAAGRRRFVGQCPKPR
jgi:hypothetical protein